MSSERTKRTTDTVLFKIQIRNVGTDKDGHTPVVVRETTEEVMKEQGKGWYFLCFQGLKRSPGHWPRPTAKE